jgi:ABC-type multidrug transport system ATPase subunit
MSEEILKALMQLFAIITKQDEGVTKGEVDYVHTFLKRQLNDDTVLAYVALFDEYLGKGEKQEDGKRKLTSVKDSVRTLGICKKINKTLTQQQKVVVLVRLFELINVERKFTDQRMAIINTVANVFNISKEEYAIIDKFVREEELTRLDNSQVLVINQENKGYGASKFVECELDEGSIVILKINSVNLYFLKYTGTQDIYLNGLGLSDRGVYLFANGSTLKVPKGRPILYSDIAGNFLKDTKAPQLSFNVRHLEFKFKNGNIGLRDINLSEGGGKLVGIMGASGAGKTTLLNVLAGLEKPSSGKVLINGISIHEEKEKAEGVIGYIPQDDLLIEELTVYQNLYYCSKLIFKELSNEEIDKRVVKVIDDLGLSNTKDLKVGSPLEKTISGGQRKRLNIALELIREPSVLFVDEPTSGLSSRDSENVMDLLRELTLKGKLIFVVIHQPSSDIYKMFDKLVILDTGGYLVYYGNPVEAVMYFKKIDNQINSDVGECHVCGNVNPEIVFNIIEAKIVDEFGRFTSQRKVSPQKWQVYFDSKAEVRTIEDLQEAPPKNLNLPGRIAQFLVFATRDLLAKVNNKQYIILNLFEAPALAFILSFIIRYVAVEENGYVFRYNDNIPAYLFMSIIVSLFLGLTVSAEEIFRDRKILKREAFLNLSRASYLFSKIGILFLLSAIQSFLFVLVGNTILDIQGMFFDYWFVLFTVSCFANILGLNISATFNSAVTIYIIIPILIIPQMILGGAMFNFEKLNKWVGGGNQVPVIADLMVSRWAYEALVVNQFKDNDFEKEYFNIEKLESMADYKQVYYIPKLEGILEELILFGGVDVDTIKKKFEHQLLVLRNEIMMESKRGPIQFKSIEKVNANQFDQETIGELFMYMDELKAYYGKAFSKINQRKEEMLNTAQNTPEKLSAFLTKRDIYHNEYLTDLVKNIYAEDKIVIQDHLFVQKIDPVFMNPENENILNYRAHFYAPVKKMFNQFFDTYRFNMSVVWFFTLILYATLYYEMLKKLIGLSDKS